MRVLFFVTLLLSCSLLMAQDASSDSGQMKDSKGQVTVRGCVSMSAGDYILMKSDPGVTYELAGKVKLKNYLGQRVEVTGTKEATLATSTDAGRRSGSPVTIRIRSIKTLDKTCSESDVQR